MDPNINKSPTTSSIPRVRGDDARELRVSNARWCNECGNDLRAQGRFLIIQS